MESTTQQPVERLSGHRAGSVNQSSSAAGNEINAASPSPLNQCRNRQTTPTNTGPLLDRDDTVAIPLDDAEGIAETGSVLIPVPERLPRDVVPRDLCDAKDAVRLAFLDNNTCKYILKAIKVAGGQNAKVATKLKIIAVKMTQRQFCLNSALDLVDRTDAGETVSAHELQCFRATTVRINKNSDGKEDVVWVRGDVPVFEGENVIVGKPDNLNGETVQQPHQREADFEASEYCRILHVLADSRMTSARTQLMEPRSREELDVEPFDPWTDQITPLFNDLCFKPNAIQTVSGGVTRADIGSLNPAIRVHERPAGVLKRKFGEFKSAYGTCLAKYEASGQGDPDSFVHFANAKTYPMHAFCFLKQHPFLTPLATRALQSDAQREEGVGEGVSPDSENLHGYGRKRKRETQQISIAGFESISSALRPVSEDVARETEEAERDKARFEAAAAKGKSAQSLLSAISQAKAMLPSASSEEEKMLYESMVKSLIGNLSGSFA